MPKHAFAYYRTSSAFNVGPDKDSLERQRAAVETYCKHNDIELVEGFYDAAVSGADAIDTRPGFAKMLSAIAGNGVRLILVETANRFARDLIVQEIGFRFLQAQGIDLIAVDSPSQFLDQTPTAILIRQILGAVAQFEKAALVARLAAARRRTKRFGGNAPLAMLRPEHVARASELSGEGLTLRALGARLAAEGMTTASGAAYGPRAVRTLLSAKR
jgi:DNA invertase Pin-like site-specific DNA recombinase